MLSLVLVLSVGAQAESVLWHDDSSHVLALYARDDSVYLFTNKAYHILTAEGETGEYSYESIETFEALIPGNDELWALFYDSERNPSIAEVSFDDGGNLPFGERLSFNWTDIQLADEPVIIYPMIDDGVFAFVDAEGEDRGVVVTYNIETGKGHAFETDADGYLIYAQAIFPTRMGLHLSLLQLKTRTESPFTPSIF